MKTNFLLLSFLLLWNWQSIAQPHRDNPFSQTQFPHNQNTVFSKQSTQYLPQLTIRDWWKTGDWSNDPDTIHNEYDSHRRLITETQTNHLTQYFYDSNGYMTVLLILNWNSINQTWDSSYKDEAIMDANGNQTLSTSYSYRNGGWHIGGGNRYTNTYNNLNQLTEIIKERWGLDTTYHPSGRSLYTYNNLGEAISSDWYDWNDSAQAFLKAGRFTNIQWYRWSNSWGLSLPLSMNSYEWIDSVYVLRNHFSYTYDSYGNEIEFTLKNWDGMDWSLTGSNKNIITYNNGAMIEKINQNFSFNSGSYENRTKETYGDFIEYTALKMITANNNQVSVYPNPATSTITVELKSGAVAETISIYNITGMKVLQANLISNQNQIDVSVLPKGLYFYKLQAGTTGKLMID